MPVQTLQTEMKQQISIQNIKGIKNARTILFTHTYVYTCIGLGNGVRQVNFRPLSETQSDNKIVLINMCNVNNIREKREKKHNDDLQNKAAARGYEGNL